MKSLKWVNLIAAIVMWSLGLLVGLFNLLGLWDVWHLAGFAWVAIVWPSLAISVVSLLASFGQTDETLKKAEVSRNATILGVSVAVSLLVVFVFATWFW